MATHYKLLAFDRRLSGAVIPGRAGGRLYTESEVAAIRAQAYREGADAADRFANQQMVELRAGVQQLQEGVFARLGESETLMVQQVQTLLPGLIVDIATRLLAGYEPSAECVEKLCREALDHLYPERENLELRVCPRDAELLTSLNPQWKSSYPGLQVVADPALAPGDCQVRSRFGVTDARLSTKLESLAHELLQTA